MKPSPGPHSSEDALPLIILLRDILKYVHTTREGKKVVHEGKVLVNGSIRKDHRFPVGLFDSISIPSLHHYYSIMHDETGKLYPKKIEKEEADQKIEKIIGKKMLPGKKTQLNLYDGRNLLVEKDEYLTGDSIILTPDNKIKKHLRFEKGAVVYLIAGKHKGTTGILEAIKPMEGRQPDRIIFKTKKGSIETLREYTYVIEKPFDATKHHE